MATATITMIDDNKNTISLELDICAETKWEAIDYLMPCNTCGKIVFNSTTEIVEDTYMCQVCREKRLDIRSIVSKAEDKFWEVIAASFPSIKTGDLSISTTIKLSECMVESVTEWYHTNTPATPDTNQALLSSPYKEFRELGLHFGQEWEIEQTGGNVFVAYLMFYAFDGEARRIGVSSECICIIDKPWTPNQTEDYAWFFSDNPTAFFCAMENYAKHSDRFDFGKLFDDCQIIAKSGLV